MSVSNYHVRRGLGGLMTVADRGAVDRAASPAVRDRSQAVRDREVHDADDRTHRSSPDRTVSGSETYEFVNKPYTFTQAGGHPWALTTTGEFTTEEVVSRRTGDGAGVDADA